MRAIFTIFFVAGLLAGCASAPANAGADFNQRVLAAIGTMPSGGGYDGSDATKNLLTVACVWSSGGLSVEASKAKPSFCSSATYLVFLKAMTDPSRAYLPVRDQKDGHGAFGRWNANGPGCAKLIADLGAGVNFTDWDRARPGDFLKIWWTDEIGGRERGHHVVYLGHDEKTIRFWSSNQPDGYGAKSVPRSKCRRVLFTRITVEDNLSQAARLSGTDPWLEAMLRDSFSWAEVKQKCRVR